MTINKCVEQWFSSEDGRRYAISKQDNLEFGELSRGDQKIYVNPAITYQSITGFGTSLEESSVYNFCQMPEASRDEVLHQLFDPVEGVGWNMLRICFGSSDFTGKPYYSYDDVAPGETDVELEQFSIQKDIDYRIVEYIKRIKKINPEVLVFASPWSPPAWMKDSGTMCGGSLLPEHYPVAARYYRMAIQAYEELGIQIHAFTVQNEPLMDNGTYPSCRFTWQELSGLVKELKKEFSAHGIKTKLWPVDHNFNMAMSYGARMIEDPEVCAAVDGFSFHDYLDEPTEMTTLHHHHPDKPIYLTERSVWGTGGMDRIIQYLRNWAKCYVAWVTCLDNERKPNSGCHGANATFVVRDVEKEKGYYYIPEVYLLGQLSAFIQRGAKRVECNYGSRGFVTAAAFLNPDGNLVLVAVNQDGWDKRIEIQCGDEQIAPRIPAHTVATFRWKNT